MKFHNMPAITITRPIMRHRLSIFACVACSILLASCSGGGGGGGGSTGGSGSTAPPVAQTPTPSPLPTNETPPSEADSVRFLTQATFGPTPASLDQVRVSGFRNWLTAHMQATGASYGGYSAAIHTAGLRDFCAQYAFPSQYLRDHCWQEYYSAEPLSREFYRNALYGTDQLRQRMGLALGQIFVVSNSEVEGTYGHRDYQQMLLDRSFGNFRDTMVAVIKSPVMGEYLNMVNNGKDDPNENFARELMQLFTIGPCQLNQDGSLSGGVCQPTYDNNGVRDLAYALTGWTYPLGGVNPYGGNGWANARFLRGDMVPVAAEHDQAARTLPGNVNLPAGHTAQQGLDAVVDALFNHPNIAPFISKQLIQHLVTSNPSPAYVSRVAQAFISGSGQGSAAGFGSGQRGDMKAVIATILLDSEARGDSKNTDPNYGRLREPAQYISGMLRAISAQSDGAGFYWWWGQEFGQVIFNAASVFNFYPPDYPLPGSSSLVGPAFAIENPNSTLSRINLGNQLLYWGGLSADSDRPGATGTHPNMATWEAQADDASVLVNKLEALLVTGGLSADIKSGIVSAVSQWTPQNNANGWRKERVATAFYLILACPEYQVQR
jgi:uncharacterized protein (DUF1800 family)